MKSKSPRRVYSACTLFILILLVSFPLHAREFHKYPYDFLFGNHLDTHQETKLELDKDGNPDRLSGYFYIIFTEDTDPESGLPIARHPRGNAEGEDCNDKDVECVVGWQINGFPAVAKFLYFGGVNGEDHPVWLVNRSEMVQPGGFTHFHWISQDSNDPGSIYVPSVCNADSARELVGVAEDEFCPGWFMEIKAIREFAFEHGGERMVVRPGIDNVTHLNLLTDYAIVNGITPTR